MNLKVYLKKRKELIDEYLKVVLPLKDKPKKLHDAIWYCVFNGGKRIRPIVMLAIADLERMPLDKVLNAACGIEMVHTSTLILDDLPSMDDALLRRSKPALHRVYGEAITILVANILLLEGVNLITNDLMNKISDTEELKNIISELTGAIGKDGVMQGQFLDLTLSNEEIKLREIEEIHKKKTSMLFEISGKVAAVISGLSQDKIKAAHDYLSNFGMAFQISDDIIALENRPQVSGKISLNKDKRPSYVAVCGKKDAQRRLNNYINKAVEKIKVFKPESEPLVELAKALKDRKS